MDTESGIETGDSDSASASGTSSEYAAAVATAATPSISNDHVTAATPDMTSRPDDVEDFIRRVMVQPPPASPACLDDGDVAVVPRPTNVVECASDVLPPPAAVDYSPRLPPLIELPEDDALSLPSKSVTDLAQCPPHVDGLSPPSSNDLMKSYEDLSSLDTAVDCQNGRDENSNFVQASANGVVAAVKSAVPSVVPKPRVRKTPNSGVNDSVSVADSRTSTTIENATTTTSVTAAVPVSASEDSSTGSHPTRQRFSGKTETDGSSSKKNPAANIWQRLLRRNAESGWSLFPRRRSLTVQSTSVVESTVTLLRRRKPPNSAQSKLAAQAAAKAREMQTGTSATLPTKFRYKPAQRSSCPEEQLGSTDRGDVNRDCVHSALSAASDDEEDFLTEAAESVELRAKKAHNYRDERGRLFNATIDPRISKASSLVSMTDVLDEKQKLPKNERHSANEVETTTTTTTTSGRSNHQSATRDSQTSGKRMTLMNIGSTLPRLVKKMQSSPSEEQSPSDQRWSEPPPRVEWDDDDVIQVRRSDYLQTSTTARDRSSPAADTNQLLCRSMTEEPTFTPPPPLLSGFLDSMLTVDAEERSDETAAGVRFDTFRGTLSPIRWSEENRSGGFGSRPQRSMSVDDIVADTRQQVPTYIDVRPPSTLDARSAAPVPVAVAAPRLLNNSTMREKEPSDTDKPQKVTNVSQDLRMFVLHRIDFEFTVTLCYS